MLYWVGFSLSALDGSVFPLSQGFSVPPPFPFFPSLPPPLRLDPISSSAAWLMQRWFPLLPGGARGCGCSGGRRTCSAVGPRRARRRHGARGWLCGCLHVRARVLNLLSQQAVLCTGGQRRLLLQGLLCKGKFCKFFRICHFSLV